MLDPEALAARIKLARKTRHLMQSQLAEMIGYSDKAVCAWERGRNAPTADAIHELCRALGVSADWLLDVKGD